MGLCFTLLSKIPGLRSFGKLPGDISWQSGNTSFYFPWVSCLLLSGLLSLLFYFLGKGRLG
jgi:hypothetical protein